MPFNPFDHDEDDDFSHLPTVDGLAPPPRRAPVVAPPPLEEPPVEEMPEQESWQEEPAWKESAIEVPVFEESAFEAPVGEVLTEPAPLLDEFTDLPEFGELEPPPPLDEFNDLAETLEAEPPPSVEDLPDELSSGAESDSEDEVNFHAPLIGPVEDEETEAPADNQPLIDEAKKRALFLAVGLHVFLILLLAIIQVAPLSRPAAEIVAISSEDLQQEPAWKKIAPPTPTASGGPSIQPIVALGTSQVAMPDVDFTPTATELNVGSSLGSFGGGRGTAGGSISFLGNQGTGSRVVFVVDVSGSMSASGQADGKSISRFELMKKELKKSLSQLKGGTQYQVIYFSDFAWPHDEVDTNNPSAMQKYEWDIRPGQQNVRIPRYRYLTASPGNLTKSRQIIEDSINPGGTNWGAGLLMALNGTPKPELIFFMTDGNRSDALTWVDEVTAANSRGKPAVIHTTAMMEPAAAKELDELARRNGGKFTVVMADGKVVKGDDFFKGGRP